MSAPKPEFRVIAGGVDAPEPSALPRIPVEGALFPSPKPAVLMVIDPHRLSADRFRALFDIAKPKVVFDLRTVPHFSFGQLSRRIVLSQFNARNIAYFDRVSAAHLLPREFGGLDSVVLGLYNRITADRHPDSGPLGPVAVLVEESDWRREWWWDVSRALTRSSERWDLLWVPVVGPAGDRPASLEPGR